MNKKFNSIYNCNSRALIISIAIIKPITRIKTVIKTYINDIKAVDIEIKSIIIIIINKNIKDYNNKRSITFVISWAID